jgi:DNA-binding CsgD family transcriptional regulator
VAPHSIIGRAQELDIVVRFFDGEPSNAHGLLIEGEAGIGKTSVWREAVRIAEGRGLVLTSRASDAEARLAFTVLGDLLVPALNDDVLAELPVGQRRAIEAALLLAEPTRTRPDSRAVSLAVLAVLRVLAANGPMTIAVDDVQWVDTPSARTLAFALRRLEAEPVRVITARWLEPGSKEPLDLLHTLPGGLERLTLNPLDEAPLGRLLRRHLDRGFPPPLVRKIHEQTGGNAFFAIEVARALGDEIPSLQPGEPLPVPSDLEGLLHRRVSALSADARTASLLLAASSGPSRDAVEAAGASAAGIQEAIEEGIIAAQRTRLEFTHPLLASTVYGNASARERRRAHSRLAQVATDPEERARHLALASTSPNEEVATALDDAAQHACGRGAPLAAAELFELAATLTPPPSDLVRLRHMYAAENLFDAGDGEGARGMLEQLLRQLEPGSGRADTLRILGVMSWNDVRRVSVLLTQALDEAGDDPFLRSMILSELAWAELEACQLARASDLSREALALAEGLQDPLPERLALKILSWTEAVLGRPARQLVDRAWDLGSTPAYAETTEAAVCLGRQLLWAGDVRGAREMLEAALERSLEQGRQAASWEVILCLADVEFRAGRWGHAARHTDNALEIALDTGRSNVAGEILSVRAAIASTTGDIEQARNDGLEAISLCERTGDRWVELGARSALGFLELSAGDPAAAHDWLAPAVSLCRAMGLREPGVFPVVPDEVGALIGLGEIDEATRLTDDLEEQGRALDRALALATAERCRGLIAGARGEPEAAVEHLDRALEEHARVEHPFETGRTLLAAGEVQRRLKRKRPARELLERARSTFHELEAPTWVEKARVRLARVGGRPPSPDGLTPTEEEVARLAAQGLTNREVAQALFLSPHTVDANLRRVYRKLQVRSRTELARKL